MIVFWVGSAPRISSPSTPSSSSCWRRDTEPGGRISLSVERQVASGKDGSAWAVLRVRDTGVGIDAALLPHVFDLFIQADHSLARSEGGLGIGLSLVGSLVKMHGGSVQAFSGGIGQGSEFIVRLPLTREAFQPARAREPKGEKVHG